jgi:hypothetical protein
MIKSSIIFGCPFKVQTVRRPNVANVQLSPSPTGKSILWWCEGLNSKAIKCIKWIPVFQVKFQKKIAGGELFSTLFVCLFVWVVLFHDVGTVGPVGTLKPDPVTMVQGELAEPESQYPYSVRHEIPICAIKKTFCRWLHTGLEFATIISRDGNQPSLICLGLFVGWTKSNSTLFNHVLLSDVLSKLKAKKKKSQNESRKQNWTSLCVEV